MSDRPPDPLIPSETPAVPDRRMLLTAAVSVALHLALVGLLVLPRLQMPEAAEPPAIKVDLVPPEVVSSSEPPPSSSEVASSSEAPPSSEPPSSAEGTSSVMPSSEPVSSEPASSAAPPLEPASSAAASSTEAAAAAAAESSAAASSASAEAPAPRGRPIVIPVGPSEASAEAESSAADASADNPSSAASEVSSVDASSAEDTDGVSELTASGAGEADANADTGAADAAAAPPPITGALHVAKKHYLDAILDAPAMVKAREAIKKLPPEKRLTQSCNIEAVGQLGNAGRGFDPDAVIADAFAKPVIDTARANVTVGNGAFRSKGKWYGIAYDCTLSKDLGAVKTFTYRVGADVTDELKARLGR